MRYTAIILGIIAVIVLLPQDAFARGERGNEKSKAERGRDRHEVVTEPVEVERDRRSRPVVDERSHRQHERSDRGRADDRRERGWHDRGRADRRRAHRHDRRPDFDRRRPIGHRHHSSCLWVPGHYEERVREVVVPGYFRNEYVPPKYVQARGPRGITVRVMVRPAGLRKVWVPPCTRREVDRVWVEGTWSCNC